MSGGSHLAGHRVREVSFLHNEVECSCGAVMKITPTDVYTIDCEQLALEFSKHRHEIAKLEGVDLKTG